MKVVINACYGGFSISLEAARHMAAAGSARAQQDVASHEKELAAFAQYRDHGTKPPGEGRDVAFSTGMWDIAIKYDKLPQYHGYGYVEGMDGGYERNDPLLIAAVESLGSEKAGGEHSTLKVVEIPDGTDYEIDEYDGYEHVAEKHRTWS